RHLFWANRAGLIPHVRRRSLFPPLPVGLVLLKISDVFYIERCAARTRPWKETDWANRKRPTDFQASHGRGCYLKIVASGTAGNRRRVGPLLAFSRVPRHTPRESCMDLAKTLKIDSVSRLHPTPPLRMGPTQTVAEAV